jgi:hypothetical protein
LANVPTAKLIAAGDTGLNKRVSNIFQNVIPALAKGDLRFAQVERTYSNLGRYEEYTHGAHSRVEPELLSNYVSANFNVVSLASNHSLDYGAEAELDTMASFRKIGISTIGVGANIAEARTPAIIERNGLRIAFLGYCSVLQPATWATETRPGIAPMRARTFYEPVDFQPGTPAHIVSIADEGDMEAMKKDIRAARERADVVVVSQHWGVHYTPRYIPDYEVQVGHAAVDAGCDLVIGHHPHILKGIEVYKGVPILHSLANLAEVSSPHGEPYIDLNERFNSSVYDVDFGQGRKFLHRDYRHLSVLAEATLGNGPATVEFVPLSIEKAGGVTSLATPIGTNNPRFNEVLEFLNWSSEMFNVTLGVKGDKLVLQN